MGTYSLVVAIDELKGYCGFCASKRRSRADRFCLLRNSLKKVSSSGVILVVASQFASVDTIPNAVKVTAFDKNSSRLCAC